MTRRPPSAPLFPTPTLFRSDAVAGAEAWEPLVESRRRGDNIVARRGRADQKIARRLRLIVSLDAGVECRLEDAGRRRSEGHTSELQSPCNIVCRLLLEKKKH